jgi:hypothetical protein
MKMLYILHSVVNSAQQSVFRVPHDESEQIGSAFHNFHQQQIGQIPRLSPGLYCDGISVADNQTIGLERATMHAISHKPARITGLAIALAAGFFFLPVTANHPDRIGYTSAWAGDQGGSHDRVSGNEGYTNYSTSQPTPVPATRCQSCRTGESSGYTPLPPQDYSNYSASSPAPATPADCDSCQNGSWGK